MKMARPVRSSVVQGDYGEVVGRYSLFRTRTALPGTHLILARTSVVERVTPVNRLSCWWGKGYLVVRKVGSLRAHKLKSRSG
jgi:hypothetical protein